MFSLVFAFLLLLAPFYFGSPALVQAIVPCPGETHGCPEGTKCVAGCPGYGGGAVAVTATNPLTSTSTINVNDPVPITVDNEGGTIFKYTLTNLLTMGVGNAGATPFGKIVFEQQQQQQQTQYACVIESQPICKINGEFKVCEKNQVCATHLGNPIPACYRTCIDSSSCGDGYRCDYGSAGRVCVNNNG